VRNEQPPGHGGPSDYFNTAIILLIVAAPTLCAWVVGYRLLRRQRVKPWQLVLPSLGALALVAGFQGLQGALLGRAWIVQHLALAALHDNSAWGLLLPGLLRMIPLDLPIGLLVAAGTYTPAEPTVPRRARNAPAVAAARVQRLLDQEATRPSDALGVYLDGDLDSWRQGALIVPPPWMFDLGMLLLGQPGVGKSVTNARLAYLMARQDRQLAVIDGKGDRDFVDEVVAGYLAAHPGATVRVWPDDPYDLWRTLPDGPDALVGKLMGVWTFDERSEFYGHVAELILRLAVSAPGFPPVASAEELLERVDLGWLNKAWERNRVARSKLADAKSHFDGVSLRIANLVATLGGKFDGSWAVDDVDLAVFTVPTVANRRVGDASMRILLGEFAHYATVRKARERRSGLMFDEFGALDGGRPMAMDAMERNRGFHVGVILSAQSVASLGNQDERERLIGSASAVIAGRSPIPAQIARLAGTYRDWDVSHRIDDQGGRSSTYTEREYPRLEQGTVRSLPVGVGQVISGDRTVQMRVIRTQPQGDLAPPALPSPRRRLWVPGWRRRELGSGS
jgi:hypothetical protein